MKRTHLIFQALLILILFTGCSQVKSSVKAIIYKPAPTATTAPPPATKVYQPLPADSRPNIIFILTDDMETSELEYMPKTKALLLEQGIYFDQYLINVPLCCPSRATTLLGQYSQNTQILTNSAKSNGGFRTFYQLEKEGQTIAVALQSAGYDTAMLGKYLNGYPKYVGPNYVSPGWTEWYVPAKGNPYRNFKYYMNENGKLVQYGDTPEDYLTDVMAGQAIDFMQRSTESNTPFFVFISLFVPHWPATPAPRHEHMFTDLQAPRTKSFSENDVSDKPLYIQKRGHLTEKQIVHINDFYVKRLQSLQAVDEMVENIVLALQSSGQLENTYIFFTSDNGYHLGQHRLADGKQTPYEEDIRVPLIVRGPGIQPGAVNQALTGNVDLAPTFAELAGVLYDPCDGRSFMPMLFGQTPEGWREAYLLQRWPALPDDEESGAPTTTGTLEPADPEFNPLETTEIPVPKAFKGVRTTNYIYIEYDTGELEFYDLIDDPYQLDNLATLLDSQFLQKLSQWLAQLDICRGQGCWEAEQIPAGLENYQLVR